MVKTRKGMGTSEFTICSTILQTPLVSELNKRNDLAFVCDFPSVLTMSEVA